MLSRAFMPVSGMRDSSSTRLRRMSMMVGTCSTTTGHSSMQAPQETQSQIACSGIAPSMRGMGSTCSASRGTLVADGDHVLLEVLDDVHGGENLARGVGRAGVGAPAAHGAGVTVQQLTPGEVLHPGRSERTSSSMLSRSIRVIWSRPAAPGCGRRRSPVRPPCVCAWRTGCTTRSPG